MTVVANRIHVAQGGKKGSVWCGANAESRKHKSENLFAIRGGPAFLAPVLKNGQVVAMWHGKCITQSAPRHRDRGTGELGQ